MTDTASLKDGFYWVRIEDGWHVARKSGEWFTVFCYNDEDLDLLASDLNEIDPRPIKREP